MKKKHCSPCWYLSEQKTEETKLICGILPLHLVIVLENIQDCTYLNSMNTITLFFCISNAWATKLVRLSIEYLPRHVLFCPWFHVYMQVTRKLWSSLRTSAKTFCQCRPFLPSRYDLQWCCEDQSVGERYCGCQNTIRRGEKANLKYLAGMRKKQLISECTRQLCCMEGRHHHP